VKKLQFNEMFGGKIGVVQRLLHGRSSRDRDRILLLLPVVWKVIGGDD
jgi:hypothetical protein